MTTPLAPSLNIDETTVALPAAVPASTLAVSQPQKIPLWGSPPKCVAITKSCANSGGAGCGSRSRHSTGGSISVFR